ncbi:tRNA lysidine(34) synthetase TilS [Luteimonas pelagia]
MTGPDTLRLPPPPDAAGAGPVVVGYSGGLDSRVLLALLARDPAIRARGLSAVHVDHGLHPHAADWATHCARTCATLGIPLSIERVVVDGTHDAGPEAGARAARHAAFERVLPDGGVLALAHHLDDQAETFLLRALRGSGVDGLAAMRSLRRFAGGWMWRPLLAHPRDRLRAFAEANGLEWVEDPSNAQAVADRNFLRHEVMPLLRTRWPGADASFARSAGLLAEAAELLHGADDAPLRAASDGSALRIDALRDLAPGQRGRVLRAWIEGLGLPPLPAEGVARIGADLLPARRDAGATFAWSGAVVRAWRGRLHAGSATVALPVDWSAPWDGRAPLELPCGGRLRLEAHGSDPGGPRFQAPVRVHARRGGERIRLPGRAHSHALKHVLQETGVPPWRRARLPLVSDADGELLAAGDVVFSARMTDWLARRGLRLVFESAAD